MFWFIRYPDFAFMYIFVNKTKVYWQGTILQAMLSSNSPYSGDSVKYGYSSAPTWSNEVSVNYADCDQTTQICSLIWICTFGV